MSAEAYRTNGENEHGRGRPEPIVGTDGRSTAEKEECEGRDYLPDAADPRTPPEEASERIGSGGGGPYTPGGAEARPYQG